MFENRTRCASRGNSCPGIVARLLARATRLALLLPLFAPPALAQFTIGQPLGQFELEAVPGATRFLLRGTMPIPKGAYLPGQPLTPFAIVDTTGETLVTQIDAVTTYPDPTDGADVVEVQALVTMPEDAQPGQRLRFPVVHRPHRPVDFLVSDDIAALVEQPGRLTLKAWDFAGNLYEADLSPNDSTTFLQRGPLTQVVRTHVTLMPVNPISIGAPTDTLPHLMGAHAYFRVRAREPFVELDLRIHNGHSGHDPTDPSDDALGEIFFKRIELWTPREYTTLQEFDDPQSGPYGTFGDRKAYWIVSGSSEYPVHYMPQQSQFVRKYAIVRNDRVPRALKYLQARDVAFIRRGESNVTGEELWSWHNDHTSNYFTQDIRLPRLDHMPPETFREAHAAQLDFLKSKVLAGTGDEYPVIVERLGWAHPWGYPHGGLAGGTEIYQYDGLRTVEGASRKGLSRLRLRAQMLTDRNPVALYNGDGEISEVEDWVKNGPNGPYLDCWYFLRPILEGTQQDPFGFTTSPSHQRDHIAAQGWRPPYYDQLRVFNPTDFQHFTRYNAPMKALIWLSNDPVAKDQMRMQAEAFRLSYNTYDNTPAGLYIGTGLKYDILFAQDYPHAGMGYGRGEGWGTEAMTAVYAFADQAWRDQMRPWFEQIIDMLDAGQSDCTGIIHSQVQSQGFDGHYRQKQNTEQVIVENAMMGMRQTVFRDVDPARVDVIDAMLTDSFLGGIVSPAWSFTLHGPWGRLAVSDPDPASPLFCTAIPPDGQAPWRDNHQSWSSLAFGFRMLGQSVFLERAKEMAGVPGATPAVLRNLMLHADELNWENQATLMTLLEDLIDG